MAIKFSFHGDRAREGSGHAFDVLGPRIGAVVTVADGASSPAVAQSGLYRIAATSASLINIAADATNGANGEVFPNGHIEVRYLEVGQRIGVSAG
jgi:hypothetical protein